MILTSNEIKSNVTESKAGDFKCSHILFIAFLSGWIVVKAAIKN